MKGSFYNQQTIDHFVNCAINVYVYFPVVSYSWTTLNSVYIHRTFSQ